MLECQFTYFYVLQKRDNIPSVFITYEIIGCSIYFSNANFETDRWIQGKKREKH